MSEKLKVLLIDSNPFWHQQLRNAIPDSIVDVTSAYNSIEARLHFCARSFDIIIVDDFVDDSAMRAFELVVEFRRGFGGKIFACCSNCNNGAELVHAGCDEHVFKSQLSRFLEEYSGAGCVA